MKWWDRMAPARSLVAKVPPLPLIRASLALKSTRIGQLGDTLGSLIHKPPADKSEWGGMEMFLDQQVRASDPRMDAVYDHFSRNLSDIIATGRRSGAGIVVSTIAVNLRDCAPFGSEHIGPTYPIRTKQNGNSFMNKVSRHKRPARLRMRWDVIAPRRKLMTRWRNYIFVRAIAPWRSTRPRRGAKMVCLRP